MTKPHGTDASGQPLDLTGSPIATGRGSVPGLVVIERRNAAMSKAEHNGVYTLGGKRFRIRAGDNLPEGAVLDAEDATTEPVATEADTGERDKGKAPENKARNVDAERKTKA